MIDKARYAGRMRALTEATAGAAIASVVLGGALAGMTPGTVAAAMTLVGLMVPPLRDLGRVQEYWHNSRISQEKCRAFLARPRLVEEREDATDLQPGPGQLRLEGVTLGGALHGIGAVAEPGQTVAIVGPNGAGKSTLSQPRRSPARP